MAFSIGLEEVDTLDSFGRAEEVDGCEHDRLCLTGVLCGIAELHHASNIPRLVPGWTTPIIIGRHAFHDQYRAKNFKVPRAGKVTISWHPSDVGEPIELEVVDMPPEGGVVMWMYNFNRSIEDLARTALNYGLQRRYPVYLATKNTILKAYRGVQGHLLGDLRGEFKADFEAAGLSYEHRLIDEMVAAH